MFTGVIFVDKPKNILSTKVDSVCKKIFNTRKVGHIGTLDPFASGILPIAINGATKLIKYFTWTLTKTYIFEVEFGKKTDTGDSTGNIIQTSNTIPTTIDIQNILPLFIGNLQQKPHIFSAVKINGKRAYNLARAGIIPKLQSKEITIYDLQILEAINNTTYKFQATVSTGTYIRSLSEDIAAALHSIAYTKELRRTAIGRFSKCVPFQDIVDHINNVKSNTDFLEINNISPTNNDLPKNNSPYINHYASAKLDFLQLNLNNVNTGIWHCRDLLDDIPVISVDAAQVRDLLFGRPVIYNGTFANNQLLLAGFQEFSELVIFNNNLIYPKTLISNL